MFVQKRNQSQQLFNYEVRFLHSGIDSNNPTYPLLKVDLCAYFEIGPKLQVFYSPVFIIELGLSLALSGP